MIKIVITVHYKSGAVRKVLWIHIGRYCRSQEGLSSGGKVGSKKTGKVNLDKRWMKWHSARGISMS